MSTPNAALRGFLAKYTPALARFGRSARTRLRKQIPGGIEFVYDNYNGLVFGYGPGERPSDAILSLLLLPRWVTLCFLKGAGMPDPDRLLKGSGNQVRHVRLAAATDLERPEIKRLIRQAVSTASPPYTRSSRFRTIIKSISAKQRPRRPA
ncbi:MAG TPA: DUF1801 domain-containing protein [Gemmatimonadales bacterium]|nr:DUF1801 domain-containing protein [Gemmatimonadales bacterium]